MKAVALGWTPCASAFRIGGIPWRVVFRRAAVRLRGSRGEQARARCRDPAAARRKRTFCYRRTTPGFVSILAAPASSGGVRVPSAPTKQRRRIQEE